MVNYLGSADEEGGAEHKMRRLRGSYRACLVQRNYPVFPVSAAHRELSPAGDATVIREDRPGNDTKVVPK